MHKARLEAFSDAVIAIIMTIMVLELKVPHGANWSDLLPLLNVFWSYVLSFLYLGIYWNNHHHLLQAAKNVRGSVLWANTHLLFWLTLIPFATAWSGENHFAELPVALYGFVLAMSGLSYYILSTVLLAHHGKDSDLARAIGKDFKGKISIVLYVLAIPISFWLPLLALAVYTGVAILWLIPDSRIEKVMSRPTQ